MTRRQQSNQGNTMTTDDTNDNKADGDQTTIHSGGGDVAGRDIDKRQGELFVEHSTIYGNITIVQSSPPPQALHQLRAPVGDFVGREREIETLVAALKKSGGAAISGVRGLGGIGKTELAYAAAQRLAAHFPDAQLLVELRGASDTPLSPEQALQTLIRAFEREAKLPDDLNELKGLYNSVLASKHILILADDARDAAQVRLLMPPAGCALLITSRNRFSLPGMATLDLGVLPPEEAKKLLLEICPRIGEHAPQLARLCGYLPLALRISAGLLETNDTRDVTYYLEQLASERLAHLSDPDNPDDPPASVEASLLLSYDALSLAAQRVLGQLGVFPASFDFAAASAIVEGKGEVTELLELLRRRSLLDWDTRVQRLSLHDLVRAFVATRLEEADSVRLRHAYYYAGVARFAEDDLYLKGKVQAGLALFAQERANIEAGWAWTESQAGNPFADTLLLFYVNATANIGDLCFDKRRERIPQLETALATARRLGHKDAEASAIGTLGLTYAALGEPRCAIECHEQHLALARETGNQRMENKALGNLGIAYSAIGDTWKAIEFFEQTFAIDRELGDRRGEAASLGNLGIAYKNLGDIPRAIEYHEQALVIDREIGNRRGEGEDLGNLGIALALSDDIQRAVECQEQCLAIAQELGDRYLEGDALNSLGLCYATLGNAQKAIVCFEQRLAIAREIGDRRGEVLTSWNLGLRLEEQGYVVQAVELMQIYVDFLREIAHPDAEKRANRLDRLRQRFAASQSRPPADAPDEA
jgi:tetratricopeptide (TPR) repeat protein